MGLFDKQFGKKEKNIFDQISELLTGKGIKFSRAPHDNAIVSYEQLERLCFNNLLHINNYQNGFSQILNKNVSPKSALEEIRLAIKHQ